MIKQHVSRRGFVGGAAAALGTVALNPQAALARGIPLRPGGPRFWAEDDAYDALAKISFNENPYGPSEKALEAMTYAFKYSMRYGYPDAGVTQAVADFHGVHRNQLLIGAGSGEILEVVGLTYLGQGKKVIGVEPSYGQVYSHASGIDADSVLLPLEADHSQNIQRMVDATNRNYRDVGFVYLCNPNNPTGRTVSAAEIQYLLENIPEDVPVLIDEAYHHFVRDPAYEESIKHVIDGRKVIVARTFSKIYGMAAIRIGFAIAPPEMIQEMATYSTGSVNVLAKWGAVASMEDTAAYDFVRNTTLRLRDQTVADLAGLGYECIPPETNFFMLDCRTPVAPIRQAFRERGVAVGRDFPPLLNHLRVSIGTEDEMSRFMTAFEDITKTRAMSGSRG
ncbi:MAG: aminotransferase class I/II-fold pyridoxal phosphate-dependent enzyme [Gemmatimonadetes bacterium]|nr:aminotransferase class I/II-fold pyridoxal phosphate-dependent enzyme [Gemmatimonadota bacterium]MDA1103917.1 aminotransferase class I/II-fold pyridoxal phosphate-dependent enzyme [Gemmatimonadota bacterium]